MLQKKKSLKIFASVDAHLRCWLIQFQVLTLPLCSPPPTPPTTLSPRWLPEGCFISLVDYAGFVQRTPIIVSILLEPIAQVSLKYLFMVTIYFLSRKQPTNCRLRISGFSGTLSTKGLGWIMVRHFLCGFVPFVFLLVLKDFIIYSKEEQYIKGY